MFAVRLFTASSLLFADAALQAQERGGRPRIDVEHYQIEAEINPRTQTLAAKAVVRLTALDDNITYAIFELNNALQVSKVLDGTGQALQVQRNQPEYTVRVNFNEPLAKGKAATLIFDYDGRLNGTEESPVYGVRFASIQADYAYLLYPARWFPVNEYTADRFAATLKIGVPTGYKVVASGLDSKPAISDGKSIFEFDSQRPSFPGSVAIVKGEAYRGSQSGVTTQVYFRGEKVAAAAAHTTEMAKVMTFLTPIYGIAPQANLTLVETEAGAPNGYAAPGILFLSTNAITNPANSRLLVNQTARQWWGLNVSPTTRNHTWLSNAGARYAEMLWVEKESGAAAYESEMKDVYVEALTVDDPPMTQAARLEDYSPEYWAVTGAKGTAVLGMMRQVMGDDKFGVFFKEFLAAYAGKSASTEDFRKLAEKNAGRSMQGFFVQWTESTGSPEFKLEYTVMRTQTGFRVMGKISQDLDTFRMPVELKIETEGNPEFKTVDVVGTSTEFVAESFGRPKKVSIDPNGRVLRFDNNMRVAVAIRRGEMFAEISEFADALKEYQKALDANRNSSLAHFRVAELFFLQGNYQSAANEYRSALNGDIEPKWVEVWSHIKLGYVFDITDQRERAVNEYNLAIRTKDNTQGAQEEAAKHLKEPYQKPARNN
jgi:aminopeptidase N